MKYRHGHWGVQELATPGRQAAPARCVVRGQYDLVIGSDLLYERDASAALAGFIARHSAPAGEVWIVDPDRGNRPAFNRHMAALGFLMREERLNRPASPQPPRTRDVLLIYRRTASALTVEGDCTGAAA